MADSLLQSDTYTRTYSSFSGCDIVASFGTKVIGTLKAITVSIQREKGPIYTMGNADPRSFSRGKRGIAGTLVFSVFDKDALLGALEEHIKENKMFYRIGGDINTKILTVDEWDSQMTDTLSVGNSASSAIENAVARAEAASILATPKYADEIPPFNVTLTFANEYGQKATMILYGLEILNQGQGFSIDTLETEMACTYVARKFEPMQAVS